MVAEILFKKVLELIEKQILVFDEQLLQLKEQTLKWSEREKWDLETGRKFNELVSNYPISEDELVTMNKVLCDFVMLTRITNVEKYFFVDGNRDNPRLPYMLKQNGN